jgi:post-segregation antitoxin (ccd killing protein)
MTVVTNRHLLVIGNYAIIGTMDKIINTKVDSELWKQAKIAAVNSGATVQQWLTKAIRMQLELDHVEQVEK